MDWFNPKSSCRICHHFNFTRLKVTPAKYQIPGKHNLKLKLQLGNSTKFNSSAFSNLMKLNQKTRTSLLAFLFS